MSTTTQWQLDEQDAEPVIPDSQARGLLFIAIGVSLLMHAAIVAALLISAQQEFDSPAIKAVRVNLTPTNPQVRPAVLEQVPELVQEQLPKPVPEQVPEPEPEPEPEPVAESAPPEQRDLPLPDPALDTTDTQNISESAPAPSELPGLPQITLPSISSMQQTIHALRAEDEARNWLYTCKPLYEDAGIRECTPGSGSADPYQAATRNPNYTALNPVREQSRSMRSLTTVYQNTGAVAVALQANAVDTALADYVFAEIAAGTSLFTYNGTDRNQHMRRMTDKSAAAKQAERVLGDAWVIGRAVELQQRKVHTN